MCTMRLNLGSHVVEAFRARCKVLRYLARCNRVLALGFAGKNAEWSLVSVASDNHETTVSVHDTSTGLLRCSAVPSAT